MRGLRVLLVAVTVAFGPPGSDAARAQANDPEPTVIVPHDLPRSEAYDKLVRFRRIQSELIYIDELKGEIPMDGLNLRPRQDPDDSIDLGRETPKSVEIGSQFILLLGFLGVLLLAYLGRHRLMSLFGYAPRDKPLVSGPAKASAEPGACAPADPSLIAQLRAMADREAALVLLLEAVLDRAASANGLRLSRSETAREFVRRLPGGWRHVDALRKLVIAEELVQFGGRALADETFEDCLTNASAILRGPGLAS